MLSAILRGIEGRTVSISALREGGLPSLSIKGLAPACERETRVRVLAALARLGRPVPPRISVVIDGVSEQDGLGLDLPIALAILGFDGVAAIGELSLSGDVRPVRGMLPLVEALADHGGSDVVLVSHDGGDESVLATGVEVHTVRTLADAVDYLERSEDRTTIPRAKLPSPASYPDMADIVGLATVRAMEDAAASGEHVLLIGPPGAGKTMLARRLTGILPDLTEDEAMEVTRVHSAAGLNVGGGLINARPFRAPHHSTTAPGLVGGGVVRRPGEVSLAMHGVLLLDEVTEFAKQAIEHLGTVLREGEVMLTSARGTVRFPVKCQVVATAMPCPCGRRGDTEQRVSRCACSPDTIARHEARIESAVARLGIKKIVRLQSMDLSKIDDSRESSAMIKTRVTQARKERA